MNLRVDLGTFKTCEVCHSVFSGLLRVAEAFSKSACELYQDAVSLRKSSLLLSLELCFYGCSATEKKKKKCSKFASFKVFEFLPGFREQQNSPELVCHIAFRCL